VSVRVCVYVCRTKFVGADIFVYLCCCCCQTQEATTLGGVRWLQMQSASDLVRLLDFLQYIEIKFYLKFVKLEHATCYNDADCVSANAGS
jgi:hypothetical protein